MLTLIRCYHHHFHLLFLLIATVLSVQCFPNRPSEAGHMTANAGQNVVFDCDVEFPKGKPIPYVVQWWKKGKDLPIYIWYDNYPTHTDKDYEGRVTKVEVDPNDLNPRHKFGLASLNITSVVEKDRGWYNCIVLFFNRDPDPRSNGTWYHLDVHAPPYFINKPDPIIYVSKQDSIILTCQAGGVPQPEIVWFKGESHVRISHRVGVFNDGTELRINNIRESDLGEYTCTARNGVGGNKGKNTVHHTSRVVMAGGAIITKRPSNMTVLEGQGLEFQCHGEANPKNVSVRWYKDGRLIKSISDLDRRTATRRNGTLVFSKVEAEDQGKYTCEVTNGIGKPITASAYLAVEYPARVSFHPDVQYIPRGLQGIIRCHIESNPPIQFVTWTKNKRIFEPFDEKGIMAIENGSIIIDKVGPEHVGDYECTPFNIHGSDGSSKPMHVKMKNPPEVTRRPDLNYHKSVGDKITLPCGAIGNPSPSISWRRVDGRRLPKHRFRIFNGELTVDNLRKSDHGVYECVIHNAVATLVVRTELFIERTTPHAPTNLTIKDSETFAVTLEWLPGYSGCSSCRQTYKIRFREKDSKFPNWIEVPANPPDARQITIHDLKSRTRYEFQVIGTNDFGDGMYSEIIEAQTKDDGGLEWSIYPPTASPSEQSTHSDCQGRLSKNGSATKTATLLRKLLSSDCIEFNLEVSGVPGSKNSGEIPTNGQESLSYFSIKLLPTNNMGEIIFPKIPRQKDIPPGEAPGPATNLTLKQEAGGWVLRWVGPPDDENLLYYTVQINRDSQDGEWLPLTDAKIDVDEASYMMKNMGTAKAYRFRVFSHSMTSFSISEELKYPMPENVKQRAVIAGLIGGILFFIVAIVLSVCTVKICNKRRRRKQERAYNLVACRISEARNGGQISQVPLKRHGKSRIPAMKTYSSKVHGLLHFYDQVSNCVNSVQDRLVLLANGSQDSEFYDYEPDYSDGRRRTRMPARRKNYRYSLHVEYPTQPGHRGLISRSKDGKFVLDSNEPDRNDDDDDGGFRIKLPPNRFRTRSVAIVAGYSPERLYSNMPPGAFVVESGVYKVGADREWERPEPIYWRQVVYGSDGSGTLPRPMHMMNMAQPPPSQRTHQVSRLGEEDLRHLRGLERPPLVDNFSQSRLIRTSNLELLRPETAAKLRASSPLNQQVPLVEWMSPLHNYSDVSSVSHRERSLPSTLLTNPLSSISSPNFSSTAEQTASSRSMKTGGSTSKSTDLHTIPEGLPDDEEGPPGYSLQNQSVVQADIHHGNQSRKRSRKNMDQLDDPYFQRTTYRNADALFPNYALNYPAPIHLYQQRHGSGTISPSRQYPPPPQGPPSSYWQSLYVQPDPRDFTYDSLNPSSPPYYSRYLAHDYENLQQRAPQAAPRNKNSQKSLEGHPGSSLPSVISKTKASRGKEGEDEASLVSEVLDAEVTAITNSSSPGSAQDSGNEGQRKQQQQPPQSKGSEESSSSGIASKNTSQNQTSSSSTSNTSGHQQQFLSPDSKGVLEPIFEASQQPFYENWPPKPYPPAVKPRFSSPSYYGAHFMQPLSIIPPANDESLPPLTPHQSMGLTGKPQATRGLERRLEGLSEHDTSLDTPPSRIGSRPGSRPGSSHSAPMLDVSIDHHYEFDTRTPTDDLNLKDIREALPQQWNRPYLGYNPRQRDREMGAAAQLARTERVFSDSEIYSPVFPRGRPDEPIDDVSERVKAMKKEFQEYREQQQQQLLLQQQQQQEQQEVEEAMSGLPVTSSGSSKSSTMSKTESSSKEAAAQLGSERLESLI